jgi:hypothetical protein
MHYRFAYYIKEGKRNSREVFGVRVVVVACCLLLFLAGANYDDCC